MREILFRGKLIEKYQNAGTWKYGSLLITADRAYHIFVLPSFTFDVEAATVGQYTGLKDGNGARIFEGDIVRYQGSIYVVKYTKVMCAFEMYKINGNLRLPARLLPGSLIIGNIHDNKELLEVKA
jgi:uncharacterized phage protein (TIGR01671 family)